MSNDYVRKELEQIVCGITKCGGCPQCTKIVDLIMDWRERWPVEQAQPKRSIISECLREFFYKI